MGPVPSKKSGDGSWLLELGRFPNPAVADSINSETGNSRDYGAIGYSKRGDLSAEEYWADRVYLTPIQGSTTTKIVRSTRQ